MSLLDNASIVWPLGAQTKAGNLAAWNPQTKSTVPFDVVRASTKTRVNEAALIESVAANVLARDFTFGGCGDFTIEDQRTNLVTQSNSLSSGWALSNVTTATSISGIFLGKNDTAVIEDDTTNSVYGVHLAPRPSITSGNNYAISFIVKKGAQDYVYFNDFNAFNTPKVECWFNLSTVSVDFKGGGVISSSIRDLGNNYFRCFLTFLSASTTTDYRVAASQSDNAETYSGTVGVTAFSFVHAQIEAGTYASSPIVTAGSAVTRLKDVPILTGASALLGDSEGGFFIEASVFENTFNGFSLSDGSTSNRFRIGTTSGGAFTIVSVSEGVLQTNLNSAGSLYTINTFFKIAGGYAVNDVALYHNGSSIITDSSWASMVGVNKVELQDPSGGPFYGRIRQFVVFNQKPTDTQFGLITTP
jgi:hypothetical protein